MVDLWYPGRTATHDIGNHAPMNGGPARATWHTTSNATDHAFANEFGYFGSGGAGEAPHAVWDPFTGEFGQLLPANSRAMSLMNANVATNRAGVYNIQIEIVFTQDESIGGKRYASVAETPCKGLSGIVNWLRSLGIPDVWPGGSPRAFARQTVSESVWLNQGGHYGHCHVPGNLHVDPGPMPYLFPAPPTPVPTPTPLEGDVVVIATVSRTGVPTGTTWPGSFLLLGDGTLKHIATSGALAAYKALGVPEKVITFAQFTALQGGLN